MCYEMTTGFKMSKKAKKNQNRTIKLNIDAVRKSRSIIVRYIQGRSFDFASLAVAVPHRNCWRFYLFIFFSFLIDF